MQHEAKQGRAPLTMGPVRMTRSVPGARPWCGLLEQPVEGGEVERLRAVGEGLVGVGVDLDQQAVGAGGQRGQGHRRDVIALAGAVAGVDQDRQVRQLLDRRDHRQVERVAAVVGEGAHAALAQDHVVVAARP